MAYNWVDTLVSGKTSTPKVGMSSAALKPMPKNQTSPLQNVFNSVSKIASPYIEKAKKAIGNTGITPFGNFGGPKVKDVVPAGFTVVVLAE